MFRPNLTLTMTKKIIGQAPFLYEGNFCEGIAYARDYGYDSVEIHVANPDELPIIDLKNILEEKEIKVSALGTGRAYVNDGLSLIDDNINIRNQAIDRMIKFIDCAKSLQSKVIVGCIRGNIPDKDKYHIYESRLGKSMQLIDAHAYNTGVTVVIEPINRYENNYLCNIYEISDFIKKYDLSNTKILIDTFHMNIEETDIIKSIEDNINNIAYVHLADSNRWYPGRGHLDFAGVIKTLKEKGYNGDLSAECLPLPTKEEAAKEWLNSVKWLLTTL